MSVRENLARTLADGATTGWPGYLREADEIIAEAREVIEWRFGHAVPSYYLRLAQLLAEEHARRRTAQGRLL